MKIFLDFDGPIIDNYPRLTGILADLSMEVGFGSIDPQKYWEQKRDCVSEAQILASCPGMTPEKFQHYSALRLQRIEEPKYLSMNQLTPHCFQNLFSLSKAAQLIMVTTRKSRENLMWELNEKKLLPHFSQILSGYDETRPAWMKKFDLIRESYEIKSGDMIIGDTEAEILCGKELGIKTIATLNGIRNRNQIEKHAPDMIVEDLCEFIQKINL